MSIISKIFGKDDSTLTYRCSLQLNSSSERILQIPEEAEKIEPFYKERDGYEINVNHNKVRFTFNSDPQISGLKLHINLKKQIVTLVDYEKSNPISPVSFARRKLFEEVSNIKDFNDIPESGKRKFELLIRSYETTNFITYIIDKMHSTIEEDGRFFLIRDENMPNMRLSNTKPLQGRTRKLGSNNSTTTFENFLSSLDEDLELGFSKSPHELWVPVSQVNPTSFMTKLTTLLNPTTLAYSDLKCMKKKVLSERNKAAHPDAEAGLLKDLRELGNRLSRGF